MIKKYQQQGDRKIINIIIDRVLNYDFEKIETIISIGERKYGNIEYPIERVRLTTDDPILFIAYRIRKMIDILYLSNQLNREKEKEFQKAIEEERFEIEEVLKALGEWYNIETYEDFLQNIDIVMKELENDDFPEETLREIRKYFLNIRTNSKNFRKFFYSQKPNIIFALEIALSKVDVSRSNKEIVKFINNVWRSVFIDLNKPKYTKDDVEIDKFLFGVTTKYAYKRERIFQILQSRQIEFLLELEEVLKQDIRIRKKANKSEATFCIRDIAEKMGIREDSLKHRLRRIHIKINENKDFFIKQETSHF